ARLEATLPGLRNHNVTVREGDDEILFLHQLAPGSADKSYGIHVARLAGVPRPVLDRAQEVLDDLETRPLEGVSLALNRDTRRPGREARPGTPPRRKGSVASATNP